MSEVDLFGDTVPSALEKGLAVVGDAVDRHHPCAVYGMFSGGHDSLCATHIASKHPRFTAAVHINTGIGVQATHEYVRRTCAEMDWPLIELKTDPEVYRQQVLKFGFPAGQQQHQVIYRLLKERRVEDLVRQSKQHRLDRVMLVAGARRQESTIRMGSTRVEKKIKAQVWLNPILEWSHSDKEDYIEEHGLPRNQVVDNLHMSGECLCGCFANMPQSGELGIVRFFYPEDARYIIDLEKEVFAAGKRPNWGQFRPADYANRGNQTWLPMCQDCPTRWESAEA